MSVVLVHGVLRTFDAVSMANLPNPDSYYKLVLLQDHTAPSNLGFVPRDNAPFGSWVHWSLPHSWLVWQLHRGLAAAGMDPHAALLWAGACLTMLCMLLLGSLLAAAVLRAGSRRSALVATLALACSLPLLGYGSLDQITHHVFMLLPLAGAAACLLAREVRAPGAIGGGLLLGLALWISPETMPFIVGLAGVRIAMRLQDVGSTSLWPTGAGLLAAVLCGWLIDPPPPGFSRWALDHISLAWLTFATLATALMALADICIALRMSVRRMLGVLIGASAAACAGWLLLVPNALKGPSGLIPAELKSLFWDQISELQPASTPAFLVAYFSIPLLGTVAAAHAAWRGRSLWLTALSVMALAYGVLGVWHTRMGAAAGLAGTLAFGIGISRLREFSDDGGQRFSAAQQLGTFLLAVAGPLQLGVSLGLATLEIDKDQHERECPLDPIATALNALPTATILAPVFNGPEILYRTHHRVIAGPYHHNVDGILDNYHAWLSPDSGQAQQIIRRRQIDYVLGCTDYQKQLVAAAPARSLAQRVADGDVPTWLEPVPWPQAVESNWRLYRVKAHAFDRESGAAH